MKFPFFAYSIIQQTPLLVKRRKRRVLVAHSSKCELVITTHTQPYVNKAWRATFHGWTTPNRVWCMSPFERQLSRETTMKTLDSNNTYFTQQLNYTIFFRLIWGYCESSPSILRLESLGTILTPLPTSWGSLSFSHTRSWETSSYSHQPHFALLRAWWKDAIRFDCASSQTQSQPCQLELSYSTTVGSCRASSRSIQAHLPSPLFGDEVHKSWEIPSMSFHFLLKFWRCRESHSGLAQAWTLLGHVLMPILVSSGADRAITPRWFYGNGCEWTFPCSIAVALVD